MIRALLPWVFGVPLACGIGVAYAACASSPLSPSEKAALDDSARACLEAAFQRRHVDAGADGAP